MYCDLLTNKKSGITSCLRCVLPSSLVIVVLNLPACRSHNYHQCCKIRIQGIWEIERICVFEKSGWVFQTEIRYTIKSLYPSILLKSVVQCIFPWIRTKTFITICTTYQWLNFIISVKLILQYYWNN